MQKFLGLNTQFPEETDTLVVVECLCVKNYITCTEQWVDEVYEMTAVEVKGRDPKIQGKLWSSTELQTRTSGC